MHFYHLYADGDWRPSVIQHFAALNASGLLGQGVRVGMVGSPKACDEAREWLDSRYPGAWEFAVQAVKGFEEVTLNVLHQWAVKADPEAPVLYAHTKGAYTQNSDNEAWRRRMTAIVVTRWLECTEALQEADVAGPYLIRPGVHDVPGKGCYDIKTSFFGGNFWWAKAAYIAKLPELPELSLKTRHAAEGWIGKSNPRMKAVGYEGWPVV